MTAVPLHLPAPSCDVHPGVVHAPRPLEQQLHHVVPRDWQREWQPVTPPFPGRYDAFGTHEILWDVRGVNVPPTCHLNVHVWIVMLMHELATELAKVGGVDEALVRAAGAAVAKAAGIGGRTRFAHTARQELDTAMQAPIRFAAAGGDVSALIRKGLWGES